MLWTDVIDPATLTGYVRQSMSDYEASRGSLARWLPNREVPDIVVRFVAGRAGLVEAAQFRAYDAEPEVGKRPSGRRVVLELPALGQAIPATEYEQLRSRNAGADDAELTNAILATAATVGRAVADAIEHLRGVVLATGKATIDQPGVFQSDDDYGRSAGFTTTAGSLWSSPSVSRLDYLETLRDLYVDENGAEPGAIVMSRRVFRALSQGDELSTQLLNGASRNATDQQVRDSVSGAGLPDIVVYDRRVSIGGVSTRVLPDDRLLLLPAPVDNDDWEGTELGATFWGRTLTSESPEYGLSATEQPGVVVGAYRNPKPPMGVEVISDAIALPVLANANLSLSAKVL